MYQIPANYDTLNKVIVMNETIGVKGGRNDRRRTLVISNKIKEALQKANEEMRKKEFAQLENKVMVSQKVTLLKTLPIVILGQVYQTLTKNPERDQQLVKQEAINLLSQENLFNEKETEEIIAAIKNNNLSSLSQETLEKLGISIEKNDQVSELDIESLLTKEQKVTEETPTKQEISAKTKEAILTAITVNEPEDKKAVEPIKANQEKSLSQDKTHSEIEILDIAEEEKTDTQEKLDKLKNRKIVDEYEKKLKDARTDLRNLIFEYNVMVEESDNLYRSEEADKLLDKVNTIIKKIEELKDLLDIPNIDKYDDNYLYTLIESYLEEFKGKKFVDEIKDSSLYIMLSEKIEELDIKKDKLKEKVETKKDQLELDEAHLEEIKDSYYTYDRFNNQLLTFQKEQDSILEDIRNKMANATTIEEKVRVQVTGMHRQSRNLLAILAAQMMLPGPRSAKGLATMAATYLYFMRNIMQPQTTTRRYKTIKVTDYHKEIENSLVELENVGTLLSRTSRQLDLTIKNFKKQYKEYLDVIPECKNLLENLEKIRDDLKEKEYELDRIKKEQEKNLEKNDAKVKRMSMNETM